MTQIHHNQLKKFKYLKIVIFFLLFFSLISVFLKFISSIFIVKKENLAEYQPYRNGTLIDLDEDANDEHKVKSLIISFSSFFSPILLKIILKIRMIKMD